MSYGAQSMAGMVGAGLGKQDYENLRNANAPITTERDTLARRLDALEQAISGLSCLVDQMEITLAPVMMPPYPEADSKNPTETRSNVSPAMEMIDAQTGRIEYQSRRLGTFLKRLAI